MRVLRQVLFAAALGLPTLVASQTTFQVAVVLETDHPDPNAFPEVYEIDGVQGRELTLVRGETYVFQLNDVAGDHPFYISTSAAGGDGGASVWEDGVTGNFAVGNETLTFVVPENAPDLLYYQCAIHLFMGWKINIVDPVEFACAGVGLPLDIPAEGGFVAYDVSIRNHSTEPKTLDIWFTLVGPPPVDILRGPVTKTFQADADLMFQLRTVIPASAPAGTYTLTCQMGSAHPTADVGFNEFDFTKSAEMTAAPVFSGWDRGASLSAELDAALRVAALPTELPSGLEVVSYPNPFNASATIRFGLPESVHTRLAVYDAVGRLVEVLVDDRLGAGSHDAVFDASNLPSGTYSYQLETPLGTLGGTMVLVK